MKMKKLFLIILVSNAIFFSWTQLGAPGWRAETVKKQPPLNEAKIRLVDDSEVAAAKNDTQSKTEVAEPALTDMLQPLEHGGQKQLKVTDIKEMEQEAPICLEWGEFTGTMLERATAELSDLKLGEKISKREMEYETGFWIYMGPLRNRKAVNKKIGELKDIGVNEYYVVPSGQWKNTISLGVFKSEDAAKSLFKQLTSKGVRTAKLGERASKLKTTIFKLQPVNAETKAKLVEIQKHYPGSEVKDVACALTR